MLLDQRRPERGGPLGCGQRRGCHRVGIELADEAWGIDFEGEIAVFVDDVPMGTSAAAARKHIKLVTILNDVSLRNLIPAELNKGFGFLHGKPATAFAPVAVTPVPVAPSPKSHA